MLRISLLIVCVVGLGAVVFGLSKDQAPAGSPAPANAERPLSAEDSLNPFVDLVRAKRENENRLREALKKPVTISFDDVPLKEAIKRLEEKTGVPIWIDRDSLLEEGYRDDEPAVSLAAQEITVHQAFHQMLEPKGLDYIVEDEVIKILTIINSGERMEIQYFEVADLLKWEEEHRYERRALSSSYVSTHRPHDWLCDLIEQETSGPWVDVDGTGGTVEVHGTVLTVWQTQGVQNEIPAILKMLRLFTEGTLGKDRSVFLQSLSHLNSDLAARRALAQRVNLDFKATPLENVAKHLSQNMRVPIVLDATALTEEGVAVTHPITFQKKGLTLYSAFRLILDPMGLEAIVSDGQIVITTTIAAEEKLWTAAYDVRDLLNSGAIRRKFFARLLWLDTSGPWVEVDGTGGQVHEPLPGMVIVRQTQKVQKEVIALLDAARAREKARQVQGFPPRKMEPAPQAEDLVIETYTLRDIEKPQQIQNAIQDLVESSSWKSNGGTGSVHTINEMLVVKNTAKVHRKVRVFLLDISTRWKKHREEIIDPFPQPLGDPDFGGFGGAGGAGLF